MAGQSVGLCQKVQPLREILEELVREADAALAAAEARLAGTTAAARKVSG